MNKIISFCLLALLGVVAPGCKSVSSSWAIQERVLVKVPYSGEPTNAISATGWRFKALVAVTATNSHQTIPAEWFMVWPPKGVDLGITRGNSLQAWDNIRRVTPELADIVHDVFHSYPMVIEPNLAFGKNAIAPPVIKRVFDKNTARPAQPPVVLAQNGPSKVWPTKTNQAGLSQPLWYQGDDFSQLARARELVESATPAYNGTIRIGILDCGFDASHVAMPEKVEDRPEANAVNMLSCAGDPAPISPGETGTPHGTGTLGILAGRKVDLSAGKTNIQMEHVVDYLGGAPHATVVPVLIAPWVFSIETANLAYGVDYASRARQCDVISMSHGGAPSLIWADAVNSAYERGTAIFAAAGDFYDLIGTDMGILVPSATVYPAGFRRVIGVTGVTEAGKTYAKNGIWNLLLHPTCIGDWLSRGSYGADLQSRWMFGSMMDADPSQVRYNGLLHPYPIAAYSPNIPWATSSTASGAGNPKNFIDLYGSGTSAATPQVAAAAALWLQQNYDHITQSNDWRSWKKAEAVYVALLASAARAKTNQPDKYLGAGILKASDALTNDYDAICAMTDTNKTLKFSKAPWDYYDGQRSAVQLLLPWLKQPKVSERAYLKQNPEYLSSRKTALTTLFFNGLLLEKYEWGRTPKIGSEQRSLEEKASDLERRFGEPK